MTKRAFAMLPILAAGVSLGLSQPAMAASFTPTAIYNFGDRLADGGTYDAVYRLLGEAPPAVQPPYSPTGDFSNGPKWTTDVAEELGVPHPGAGLKTNYAYLKTNYAYENATAQGFPNSLDPVNGLGSFRNQIVLFVLEHKNFKPTDVATVTFGGNDISLPQSASPPQDVTNTVQAIVSGLNLLASAGAKHILVTNLPDITLAPLFSEPAFLAATGATRPEFQALVNGFNAQLAAALQAFQTKTGLDVKEVDLHTLFESIAANPSAYGFNNITQPVLAIPPAPGSTSVYNPAINGQDPAVLNASLFIDPFFDLTSIGQLLIAQAVVDTFKS